MAGAVGGAIPVRMAPYVLEPDGQGSVRVCVVVEVDTTRLSFEGGGRRTMAPISCSSARAEIAGRSCPWMNGCGSTSMRKPPVAG